MMIFRKLGVVAALVTGCLVASPPSLAQFNNDNLLDSRPAEIVAVDDGDFEGLRSLLIGGSNTGVSDSSGRSILMAAAALNDVDIMQLLFEYDVQTEQQDRSGSTALHWAVLSGSVDATILLLEQGADVNAQTDQGITPLIVAVREADRFLVEELLLANPDLSRADYTGRTAMDWARTSRDRSIEKLLLDAGAN